MALWKEHALVGCDVCHKLCCNGDFHWDHNLALVDGGAHEIDNLRPLCAACHKPKSAREHSENARAKRREKKHSNPKPPGKIKSRGFDKTKTKKFNGTVITKV